MKKIVVKIMIFFLSLLPGRIVRLLFKKDKNDSWLL
jgi:hypothetical protein